MLIYKSKIFPLFYSYRYRSEVRRQERHKLKMSLKVVYDLGWVAEKDMGSQRDVFLVLLLMVVWFSNKTIIIIIWVMSWKY